MQQRKLADLNLIDDFLFFTMMNDKEIGEEFGRYLLEIIFDRKFGKLKVVPQKVYYGADTDKHGVRLDVYLEEEIDDDKLLQNATIYDLEPESESKSSEKDALPRRVRFYHSKIDAGCLGSGVDYGKLKKVIVVIIMPFDPFGYDHMIYTIQNTCLEVPQLVYDDGAKTLFLYTKGKKGNPSNGLRELLRYMENTKQENVKNDDLQAIHNMVKVIKQDAGVSKSLMKIYERERMIKEEGIQQGIEQGIKQGILSSIKVLQKMNINEVQIKESILQEFDITEEAFEELYRKIK